MMYLIRKNPPSFHSSRRSYLLNPFCKWETFSLGSKSLLKLSLQCPLQFCVRVMPSTIRLVFTTIISNKTMKENLPIEMKPLSQAFSNLSDKSRPKPSIPSTQLEIFPLNKVGQRVDPFLKISHLNGQSLIILLLIFVFSDLGVSLT